MKLKFMFMLLAINLSVLMAQLKNPPNNTDHCRAYDIDCSAECTIYNNLTANQEVLASREIRNPNLGMLNLIDFTFPKHVMVGGNDAPRIAGKNAYPYMVALFNINNLKATDIICGASIIGKKTLLTAAHCFYPLNPKDRFVGIAGDYNLGSIKDGVIPTIVEVAKIVTHPKYKYGVHYNDIAILILKSELKYSVTIKPVCLPSIKMVNETFNNIMCVATGWGRDAFWVGNIKETLQEAQMPVIPRETCQKIYSKINTSEDLPNGITKDILCAGEIGEVKKDACDGDSGGPLVTLGPDKVHWIQIGIVSAGVGCGGEFPGLYTRVTNYLSWIQTTLGIEPK